MDWHAPVPADQLDGIAWSRIIGTTAGVFALIGAGVCFVYGAIFIALVFTAGYGIVLWGIGAALATAGLALIGIPWLPWRKRAPA